MIFVKAVKCLSLATALLPLGGCAVGLGLIFGSFLRAVAYSPEMEDALFSHAMLGFALVETFMVVTLGTMGLIYSL